MIEYFKNRKRGSEKEEKGDKKRRKKGEVTYMIRIPKS